MLVPQGVRMRPWQRPPVCFHRLFLPSLCFWFGFMGLGCDVLDSCVRLPCAFQGVVDLWQTPGQVYMGQVTNCQHQIVHFNEEQGDLVPIDGLGDCKVAVQIRCSAFRHSRSTLMHVGPKPDELWHAVNTAFQREIFGRDLRLPAMEDLTAD